MSAAARFCFVDITETILGVNFKVKSGPRLRSIWPNPAGGYGCASQCWPASRYGRLRAWFDSSLRVPGAVAQLTLSGTSFMPFDGGSSVRAERASLPCRAFYVHSCSLSKVLLRFVRLRWHSGGKKGTPSVLRWGMSCSESCSFLPRLGAAYAKGDAPPEYLGGFVFGKQTVERRYSTFRSSHVTLTPFPFFRRKLSIAWIGPTPGRFIPSRDSARGRGFFPRGDKEELKGNTIPPGVWIRVCSLDSCWDR